MNLDDFDKQIRNHLDRDKAILNGNFRLVLEDEVIFGLCYAEALDRAKKAIVDAGYTVWDSDTLHDWQVEYFVEVDEDEDLVLFATIESEAQS